MSQISRKTCMEKFHSPENLAKSISIESAELLEPFQLGKEYNIEEVSEELADVLIHCLYMADLLNLDVKEIILNKMEKNTVKYLLKSQNVILTNMGSF